MGGLAVVAQEGQALPSDPISSSLTEPLGNAFLSSAPQHLQRWPSQTPSHSNSQASSFSVRRTVFGLLRN